MKNIWDNQNLIKVLKGGGVAVMPTDTIYGIVGRAENQDTVERIYKLRKRNPQKPCIILIGNLSELEKFRVVLTEAQKNKIKEYWPADAKASAGPLSIVLDCPSEKFKYLHRGTKTLAFRLPLNQDLRKFLLKTGPLIAPSANLEAKPPSQTITQAKKYFGPVRSSRAAVLRTRDGVASATSNGVDLYVNGGKLGAKASRVIRLYKDGSVDIIRK